MRNSFGIGDIVRIGKGKVEYEIIAEPERSVYDLKGEKSTRKGVSWDKLTLVRDAAPVLTDAQAEECDETYADHGMAAAQDLKEQFLSDNRVEQPMAAWEIELLWAESFEPSRPWLLTVDHKTSAHKSYGAACDALVLATRAGFKHYAVIDHRGERKATRVAA